MRKSVSAPNIGSIESVTGWPGAQSDERPSTAGATIPRTKMTKPGSTPDRSLVFEGSPMLIKSRTALQFGDPPRFEVKAEANGKITGYGSVFDVVDGHGERVIKGAFAKSLTDHDRRGTMPKMLWQHHGDCPIGRWQKMAEDQRGLYVEGLLNLKTTAGRDAYEHLVAGDVDGMSIGYREQKARPGNNIRDLVELDLFEISVVTFPANREAVTETIKSFGSKLELVDTLRKSGLSKTAAQLVAAGGWKALSKSNEIDDDAASRLVAEIDRATQAMKDI